MADVVRARSATSRARVAILAVSTASGESMAMLTPAMGVIGLAGIPIVYQCADLKRSEIYITEAAGWQIKH